MGSQDRRQRALPIGPLHLAVERCVHCPRGGIVPLDRCLDCDLMQGTLLAERLEVLCAYPEAVPAIRAAVGRGRASKVTGGMPAATPSKRDSRRAPELIFDADWPEEE